MSGRSSDDEEEDVYDVSEEEDEDDEDTSDKAKKCGAASFETHVPARKGIHVTKGCRAQAAVKYVCCLGAHNPLKHNCGSIPSALASLGLLLQRKLPFALIML